MIDNESTLIFETDDESEDMMSDIDTTTDDSTTSDDIDSTTDGSATFLDIFHPKTHKSQDLYNKKPNISQHNLPDLYQNRHNTVKSILKKSPTESFNNFIDSDKSMDDKISIVAFLTAFGLFLFVSDIPVIIILIVVGLSIFWFNLL